MEGELETEDSAVEAVEPLETEDPERVLLSRRVKRGRGNPSMIMLRSRERGPASTIWTNGQIKTKTVERGSKQLSGRGTSREGAVAVAAWLKG